MHKNIGAVLSVGIWCLLALVLAGCDTQGTPSSPAGHEKETGSVDPMKYDPLDVGDKIEIDLNAGTSPPLQGVLTDIKEDGTINLPDIGRIQAAGKTPGELEQEIQTNYVPGFYVHMTVTVSPVSRFFYVGGEINVSGASGKQTYTGPITVTQAIRAAGDFNPFAAKKSVKLRRRITGKTYIINCVKAINHPELDLPVYPGDTIFVPRRIL
jgi:polysaccharide export outer membrane protein